MTQLLVEVAKFCEERDWAQFHNAKELAVGLTLEAGELLEIFRFLNPTEVEAKTQSHSEQIRDELADIFFLLLRFAERYNVDLELALKEKLKKSALKYPIEKARGSNIKYTELD